MDRKAAVSNQQSAISENQDQHQKRFTTEDREATHPNEPKPGSLGAPATAEGKTLPLIHGKPSDEQERVKQRAEALVRRIGEACDELERLAEENPALVGRVTHGAEEHKEAYLRLKARLEVANAAPRCRWVRQDGTGCGSPQMKRHIYCFAHKQLAEAQALALMLPALEDANAIQVGLMRIQKALIDDTISTKKAGLLLYSMQLALQNVGQVTFGQAKAEQAVTETVSVEEAFRQKALREEALSSQRSAVSQDQPQNPLTTKDKKDAKEEEGVPRMNADGRGCAGERKTVTSEPWPGPVEFRVPPELYRMDTREGMEAYEASFRMKIKPGAVGERRPSQADHRTCRWC